MNLRHQKLPEKCVMFNACLPQLFRGSVIGQFETNCGLELFKLPRANLNIKVVSFVADL